MAEKYVLCLTAEERAALDATTRKGTAAARKLARARAFLLCDQGEHGPGWKDADVAAALGMTTRSLESWRKRACEDGPLESLNPRPHVRKIEPLLDGEAEAELIKLACSTPPEGRARWSLRLLASRLVELEVVEAVSHETVRRVLKKVRSSRG